MAVQPYTCKKIIINEGITSIGDSTFCVCDSLTKIKIPESITIIGEEAFAGCRKSLTNVTLPEGITTINARVFQYCESLTEIKIPSSVTFVGEKVFNECINLKKIYHAKNFGFEWELHYGNRAELISY